MAGHYKRGSYKPKKGDPAREPLWVKRAHLAGDPITGTEPLTKREEGFVMSLLQGRTAADAYRENYSVENCQTGTIYSRATDVKKRPRVQAALRYYQRAGMDVARVTSEMHLAELARLRELAVDATQISAGVQAEVSRGRVAGLYEDKLRLSVGPTDEQLLHQVRELLGPDLATNLGNALGGQAMIDITPSDESQPKG